MSASSTDVSLLLVLDGWGHSDAHEGNAIAQANTPVWDSLWQNAPHTLIHCAGEAVGLPANQMGSSEVGHMNIGAGRVVYQELTRVSQAMADGSLAENSALRQAVSKIVGTDASLHVFGLLSPGGVHSHENHIHALVRMAYAQGVTKIIVHAFLDGRDTPPRSATSSLEALIALCEECSSHSQQTLVGSLCGRYFSMDRDQRWDRTKKAYDLLVSMTCDRHASDALEGLQAAYNVGESDEFVLPTGIGDSPVSVRDGDACIFMNFRSDRARQLTRAFTDPDFTHFHRQQLPKLSSFTTLTQYADDIKAAVAFPSQSLRNTLGEYLSSLNQRQLRIAETEKYAHVTFFFNGGNELAWPGEDRILIPSPQVATYDLQPEMSAEAVTDAVIKAIEQGQHSVIICNFANGDMVGHTGVFNAAVRAVETLDFCLGRILVALSEGGRKGQCLITADHGNVEQMNDQSTGQAHTAHTCEPVPLVYSGPKDIQLGADGRLSDIAPTLLELMDIPQPPEMTGHSLLLKG